MTANHYHHIHFYVKMAKWQNSHHLTITFWHFDILTHLLIWMYFFSMMNTLSQNFSFSYKNNDFLLLFHLFSLQKPIEFRLKSAFEKHKKIGDKGVVIIYIIYIRVCVRTLFYVKMSKCQNVYAKYLNINEFHFLTHFSCVKKLFVAFLWLKFGTWKIFDLRGNFRLGYRNIRFSDLSRSEGRKMALKSILRFILSSKLI